MAMNERQALELWRRSVTASVRSDTPDLTARQQAILMNVSLTRGPHTVRGLAENLNIAKPAVTRALDTLTRLELVRRVKDENDLRNVFIERTQGGLVFLRGLAAQIMAAEQGDAKPSQTQESDKARIA
jgi:DNA-binding MarR family transcriptional regulator